MKTTFSAGLLAVENFDPEGIRALVARAKKNGLVHGAVTRRNPAAIAKNGEEAITAPASNGVSSQWMEVDPGTAAHWLQNNFVNRPIVQEVIDAYARDMVRGVWVQTHQGVAFNDLDHLIDGQHRLYAIIKTGITVRMMVTFGLPSKIAGSEMTTMDAVDRGRTRSVADQLKIQHGFKNGAFIAMLCASLGSICNNVRTRRLTVGQTLEIYREFEHGIHWIFQCQPKEHGLKAKGVLAALAFAVTADVKLKAVCGPILDGIDLDAGSPLALLRDFLVSDDAKLLNRSADRALAELTLLALQLQLAGERPEKLELSPNGLHCFRALQPDRVERVAQIFKLS
ncbi:MAG: hypothetical protein ABIS50_15240 [Luteolibacter sp.]|uniref:hypothetical protein n=1 Tax=Luteolibacter sp. TaxID=1962973 RepID=UPI003267BFAB